MLLLTVFVQDDQSAGVSGRAESAERLRGSERASVREHDAEHLCGADQKPAGAATGAQECERELNLS